MTDSIPVAPSGAESLRPLDGKPSARARIAGGAQDSVAFKALFDSLEQRAERLSKASERELSRDGLASAVGDARASLEEVLSLKDRLLEEWRAAEQQARPKS